MGHGIRKRMPPLPDSAFSRLLEVHARLERLFAVHQELLLERRFALARDALSAYQQLLELHMRHEEELLLPLYTTLGPAPARPPRLYTGQHQRMRELLASAAGQLQRLEESARVMPGPLIALLDHERTFKHLAEHHDAAEQQGLFAVLSSELDPREQTRIVDECLAEWHRAEKELLPELSRVRARDSEAQG